MKITCLVKFVPNLDKKQNEKSHLVLDPESGKGLAVALGLKKTDGVTVVNVVSMGPRTVSAPMKDLVRLGADDAVLLSDRAFAGSDSYATSHTLVRYLGRSPFDYIITGTRAMDGSTGHVGPQIAEMLGIAQVSDVVAVRELSQQTAVIDAVVDESVVTFSMPAPAVLSIGSECRARLGFVRFQDLDKNVDGHFTVCGNEQLRLPADSVGARGSLTRVRDNRPIRRRRARPEIVRDDDAGIERVHALLKEKGVLA